ncbi:unnamed protein product, partial [Ectocarpus sp. 6 AP-2014]
YLVCVSPHRSEDQRYDCPLFRAPLSPQGKATRATPLGTSRARKTRRSHHRFGRGLSSGARHRQLPLHATVRTPNKPKKRRPLPLRALTSRSSKSRHPFGVYRADIKHDALLLLLLLL